LPTALRKIVTVFSFLFCSIIIYAACTVLVFFVWHFLSDGDFSFLMTLGSLLTLISFGLVVAKVFLYRNTSGVSVKALQAYALVFFGRLCSILFYEGYLPFDKSGDWFYQACEVTALLMVVGLLVAAFFVYPRSNKDKAADSFINLQSYAPFVTQDYAVAWIALPCLLLALILHPNLNNNFFTDTAWTFALYLEALAILPQLSMFHRQHDKEIEPFTANFVFGVAAARLLTFLFWLSSYHELNDKYAETFHKRYPGVMVVLSQVRSRLIE
jgi:ER lumen protein retaining receptor